MPTTPSIAFDIRLWVVVKMTNIEKTENTVSLVTEKLSTRPNLKIDNKLKPKSNKASIVGGIIAQMFVTN